MFRLLPVSAIAHRLSKLVSLMAYGSTSVSLHDMSRISEALVEAFYGEPAKYSYFYGLSTGGRQGRMLAQRYPSDFNGIVASMPAVRWTRFLWTTQWPTFVMDKMKFYPRPCEAQAMFNAAIAYCDPLDGVKDGIISRLDLCDFKPRDLVGQGLDCGSVASIFPSEMASLVEATLEGPRSSAGAFQWHGFSFEAMLSSGTVGRWPRRTQTMGGNATQSASISRQTGPDILS
jgi:pimeloyl-ACP methyl ester carboxylesterase